MPGPLADYRVLELTSTVSGPMTAMMLADQGADVIKIEPPMVGDPGRFLGSVRNGMTSVFAVLNRNKRSLILDLKYEAEKKILLKLVETADVLVENYRPGILEKQGLGYEALCQVQPRLIYASISGYGQTGPYKNRKVYDPLIQSTTGMVDAQRHGSGGNGPNEPSLFPTIMFDKVTALITAQAVTAALLQREKTGRGQHLPISMLDSALYYSWADVMATRTLLGEGIGHTGELADFFQIYQAKDGHVSIVLVRDDAFELLCVWRGAELHQDERFKTFAARLAHPHELHRAVDAILADVTTEEICEALDAFNVPVARVNSLDDLPEDPQIRHAGSLVEVEHPVGGAMRMPRPPFRFEGQDAFPKRPAPAMGEHVREILGELGVDEPEIERLEKREATNREVLKSLLGH